MSIKKRLLSLSLAALLCIPAFAGCFTAKAAAADTGVTINVYNWGQYISD